MLNRVTVLCAFVLMAFALPIKASAQISEEEALKRYVLGNTLMTLYHEFGHAIVTEFELPVVGREEDAVDTFSVLEVTNKIFSEDTSDDQAEELDYYLWATIDAWLIMAERDEDGYDEFDYAGEHSLDFQRFYSHLCLVYGSDPEFYEDLVEQYEVDPEVVEDCAYNFEVASENWIKILDNNQALRAEDAAAEDVLTITIEDGGDAFGQYEAWVRDWPWLIDFEQTIEADFDLPQPIDLRFESCDDPNAFWDPEEGAMTLCYEIMDEYAGFYRGE